MIYKKIKKHIFELSLKEYDRFLTDSASVFSRQTLKQFVNYKTHNSSALLHICAPRRATAPLQTLTERRAFSEEADGSIIICNGRRAISFQWSDRKTNESPLFFYRWPVHPSHAEGNEKNKNLLETCFKCSPV